MKEIQHNRFILLYMIHFSKSIYSQLNVYLCTHTHGILRQDIKIVYYFLCSQYSKEHRYKLYTQRTPAWQQYFDLLITESVIQQICISPSCATALSSQWSSTAHPDYMRRLFLSFSFSHHIVCVPHSLANEGAAHSSQFQSKQKDGSSN